MTPLATFLWIIGVIFLIFAAASLGYWDGHSQGLQDGRKQECDWWIGTDSECDEARQKISRRG